VSRHRCSSRNSRSRNNQGSSLTRKTNVCRRHFSARPSSSAPVKRLAQLLFTHPSDFLYVVQGGNRALRYGIGVGRDGFQWAGLLKISRKAEWPDWIPPPEMIERQPYLPRFMAGGPGNPLGARAMFLAIRSTESMEPTSRKLSGTPCLPAAFAWSIRMSWTCMTAFPSAPKSSSDMLPHFSQPLRVTATRNKVSLS